MTAREAMLAAVRADPHADLPRLAYADWLEDHGSGDRDAATGEFIRLSCGNSRPGRPMPRPVYPWLHQNWQRLVPKLVAAHVRTTNYPPDHPTYSTGVPFVREGRAVLAMIYVGNRRASADLHFQRGFVTRSSVADDADGRGLARLIQIDQPLSAFPRGKPESIDPHHWTRALAGGRV